MPTYEYLCTACNNEWEEVQRISADALEVCPKCGKNTAKRQISAGNFILKGGGWYADLYSSSPKPKGDGGGEAKSSETKSEGKSEGAAAKSEGASGGATAAPAAAPAAASPTTTASPSTGGSGGSKGSSGSST